MQKASYDPLKNYTAQELIDNGWWDRNYAFCRIREIGLITYLRENYDEPLIPWSQHKNYEEYQKNLDRFKDRGPSLFV